MRNAIARFVRRDAGSRWLAGSALSVALAGGTPMVLRAHHAFTSEFDIKKPITVTGVVTKIEWTNPHAWFYVDGKDETGKKTNWSFEGAAPSVLIRRGVPKGLLKVGDTIVLEGYRAKDGTDVASSAYVTMTDGKKFRIGVVGGPTDEEKPH